MTPGRPTNYHRTVIVYYIIIEFIPFFFLFQSLSKRRFVHKIHLNSTPTEPRVSPPETLRGFCFLFISTPQSDPQKSAFLVQLSNSTYDFQRNSDVKLSYIFFFSSVTILLITTSGERPCVCWSSVFFFFFARPSKISIAQNQIKTN